MVPRSRRRRHPRPEPVGKIIQKLRPQRDSNRPTGTHENFRRGAALREIVSDVGRFEDPCGVVATSQAPWGSLESWQMDGKATGPFDP